VSFAAAGTVVAGPLDRSTFERFCIRAGIIRMFTHGVFNTVDSPLSGLVLNDAEPTEPPYQGHEIAAIDLSGCERVELWACDSGIQVDFLGEVIGNDEPLGIGSYFLLAGAHIVIGSLWKQPAMIAGLIAAAFASVSNPPGSAERDARALSQALASYRHVVREGGLFEAELRVSLATFLHGPYPFASAVHAAWCSALGHLARQASINLPWSAVQAFEDQEDRLDEARRVADDPEQLDRELHQCARSFTSAMRGHYAWAGWRVLARDRSVF
jgi:hypothetical protein